MMRRLKIFIFKFLCLFRKVFFLKDVLCESNVFVDLDSKFEGNNKLYENTIMRNSELGLGTYIGPNSFVCNANIGRFCSVGPNFYTISGRHPVGGFVSTHPAFFSSIGQAGFSFVGQSKFQEHEYVEGYDSKCVIIKNDVWIGVNVTIAEGVCVGNGAVIGANSLVLHDVGNYEIVAGCPARKIRNRFTDEQISKLLDISWWDKSIGFLRANVDLFDDIDVFLSKSSVADCEESNA